MDQIKAAWLRLPRSVRAFIVDFVETAAGLVIAVNVVIPTNRDDAVATAGVIVGAIASAFVSAARRHAPGWVAALRAAFPTTLL